MRLALRWLFRIALVAAAGLPAAQACESLVVRAKPAQAIEVGEAIPISVSVGAVDVAGVRAGTVNLNLRGHGRSIAPQGLKLCTTPAPCDGAPLTLQANTTHTLWLHGAAHEGVYDGTVEIDHLDDPAGNAVLVTTISVSSPQARWSGVALIAAGVLGACLFTVALRHAANRRNLISAAAVAREEVRALLARLAKLTPPIHGAAQATEQQLEALLAALDVSALERNGLPKPWSAPWKEADLWACRTHIGAQVAKAQGIKVVIEEGLVEIEALLQAPTGLQLADLRRALAEVQGSARFASALPPSEDVVRLGVHAAISSLVASARHLQAGQWTPVGQGATAAPVLQMQVARVDLMMWAAVLVLTTGVGAALLVWSGPTAAGFGSPEDLVRCALWGLGLSVGTQLTSTAMSSRPVALGGPRLR